MSKKKYWAVISSLVAVGILSAMIGISIATDKTELELFQRYQDNAALYEQNFFASVEVRQAVLEKAEREFIRIALATKNKNLSAAGFYSSGAIWLEEFWQNKEASSLRKAIVYFQESLRISPGLRSAKRNLERALREVKERGLADKLGLPSDEDMEKENSGGQKAEDGSVGDSEEGEDLEPGNANIEKSLPYSDERGYGRGSEFNDY